MRNGCLAVISCFVLGSALMGHALELEYISPERKAELEKQFDAAEFSSKNIAAVKQKKWTCDMYGMRTGLQVKRGVNLYAWNSIDWHNEGAQVVRDYVNSEGKLIGKTERFEDQLKMNSRGQLLSRLSLTEGETRKVVAYSVCDAP